MGVINPEAGERSMDASTRSMRHSAAIGCQEIGLVTLMFFFELLFPYVLLQRNFLLCFFY